MPKFQFSPAVKTLPDYYLFNNTDLTTWLNSLLDVEGGSPAINKLKNELLPVLDVGSVLGTNVNGLRAVGQHLNQQLPIGTNQVQEMIIFGPDKYNFAINAGLIQSAFVTDRSFNGIRIDEVLINNYVGSQSFAADTVWAICVGYTGQTAVEIVDVIPAATSTNNQVWFYNGGHHATRTLHPFNYYQSTAYANAVDHGFSYAMGKILNLEKINYLSLALVQSGISTVVSQYDATVSFTLF